MLTVIVGFTLLFWGIDAGTLERSFEISGSSVTTLGFAAPDGRPRTWLAFIEAIIGLGLVALLISYLPTIYAAHHDREKGITHPAPVHRDPGVRRRHARSPSTASTRSTTPSCGARRRRGCSSSTRPTARSRPSATSPRPPSEQSWVASVGALLDTGALLLSGSSVSLTADTSGRHQGAMLMLAHGIPTVVEIGRASGLPIGPPVRLAQLIPDTSQPPPPISVTREEFDAALDRLADVLSVAAEDRDAAWHRFAWARSSYDRAVARTGRTHHGLPRTLDHRPPGGRGPAPPRDQPTHRGRLDRARHGLTPDGPASGRRRGPSVVPTGG